MVGKNIESALLRTRRKEATYERIQARLAWELRRLIAEKGFTIETLSDILGFTFSETRQRINFRDLRISQLVDILDALDLEPYFIFRPRRGWIVQ